MSRWAHALDMAIGRPTKPLNVTPQEKQKLTMLARRLKSGRATAMRARIVLGCEEGLSNGDVAKKLRITGATVCKCRERFRVNRLEGSLDEVASMPMRLPFNGPRSASNPSGQHISSPTPLPCLSGLLFCLREPRWFAAPTLPRPSDS
jgi:hypothetical protein